MNLLFIIPDSPVKNNYVGTRCACTVLLGNIHMECRISCVINIVRVACVLRNGYCSDHGFLYPVLQKVRQISTHIINGKAREKQLRWCTVDANVSVLCLSDYFEWFHDKFGSTVYTTRDVRSWQTVTNPPFLLPMYCTIYG